MRPLSVQRVLLMIVSLLTVCLTTSIPVAGQQKTTPSGSPLEMRLCVDNGCEKLVWRGTYYDGIKDKGSDIANHYTVDQWSKEGIRLEGKSVSPVSTGRVGPVPIKTYVEGVFTGPIAVDGRSVENGVVNWKIGPQHGEKVFTLTWESDKRAVAAMEACSEGVSNLPSPSALEVCDGYCIVNNDKNVSTWVFEGTKGTANWQQGQKANLTIQEWSNGQVAILREDPPTSMTAGLSAVYRGSVCGGTIKGTVTARWIGHYNELSLPWVATVPVISCDGIANDSLRLMDIANTAIRFRQRNPAFQCLSRAAELGDRDARTATGLMYRDGIGTKVSYPDAIRYLKQSAIQEDYNAQLALSQIYDIGLGVSPDPAQAKQWETRAFRNPVAVAYRQNVQNAKDMQRMAFLGLSALVEAMATPSVYVVR
jgi:hypothetical protein